MAFLVIFLLFLLAQGLLFYKWLTDWAKRIKSTWHQTLLTLGFLLFFPFFGFGLISGSFFYSFFVRNARSYPILEGESLLAWGVGFALSLAYLVLPFILIGTVGGILFVGVGVHYLITRRKWWRK